jgi:HlyD family secretion protein
MNRHRPQGSAWILVICSLIFCIAGYLLVKYLTRAPSSELSPETAAVVTVATTAARFTPLAETVELTGTVAARNILQVSSELNGLKVEQLLADEGEQVRRGQTLIVLNTDILDARLRQYQARHRQLQAALAKAEQPQRPLEIAQLESAWRQSLSVVQQEKANLTVAEAAFRDSKTNRERYQDLYKQGAIALTESESRGLDFERQKGTVQAAKDRVLSAEIASQQAKERLQLAQQGGRTEDVQIAQAQMQELTAQMEELQTQISQAQIKSPDDGLLLARSVNLGQIVSLGTPLFEVAQKSELELRGEIPATLLSGIRVGQPVTVSGGSLSVEGTIWKVSPTVDSQTRNAQIRIALPADSEFRPGMFAQGTVSLEESESLVIPMEALYGESPKQYVFTLDGNKARRREVTVGKRQQGLVTLNSGLKVGEKVITEGGGFLRDGDVVALP